MYSFPNFEPVHCSMYGSNCCFLTCIQVPQEAGKVVRYSHLFKNVPQFVVIPTVKGFSIVNEAKEDNGIRLLFLWSNGCCQFDLCSPAVSKSSLNTWKFLVHVLSKPSLQSFQHYKHVRWVLLYGNLNILWHCLSLGLEWKFSFSSPVATAEFSKFAAIMSASFHNIIIKSQIPVFKKWLFEAVFGVKTLTSVSVK